MLKNSKKVVSILLTLVMVLGLCSITLPVSAKVTMETKDGFLDFEAEDTDYAKDRLVVVSDSKLYSKGKALNVSQEDKFDGDAVPVDAAPHIDLSFKADKAGTYTIWMRNTASVADQAGQSVYFMAGSNNYAWTKLSGEIGKPAWTKLGTVPVTNAGDKAVAKLRVRQMKDINIDRFIITSDTSYKPDDAALGLVAAATPKPSKAPGGTAVSKLATTDGFVMEEAENLPYNKDFFDVATGKEMSGGKALAVNTEDKTVPGVDADPELNLSFTPDKNGTYAVWMRLTCNVENSSGNSMFLSVDNSPYAYSALTGSPTEFGWHRVCTVTGIAGKESSIRIIKRQSHNIVFDKVLITNNRTYTPTGMGEKPQAGAVTAATLPPNVYPAPTIKPVANQHPRVMFTKNDIATIKANFDAPQNAAAYAAFQKLVASPTDGKLAPSVTEGKSNFSQAPLTNIESLAFDYAINGNEANGKAAIEAIKNYYETVEYYNATDSLTYRYRGAFIFTVAQVYDWCYPLMDNAGRAEFMAMAESIAMDLDIGYPPSRQGSISGHGGEVSLLKDLLALGIASYDERPDLYNYVAGRILSEYIEPRNYWYVTGTHNQGNAYGDFRGSNEVWSAWLFKRMSGVEIYKNQQLFPYEWLYSRRPDGQVLRDGDDYWQAGSSSYWSGWLSTLGLASNLYGEEYLKREFMRESPNLANFSNSLSIYTAVTHLAFNDPNLNGKPASELPLSRYFSAPKGMMIARTGWNDGVEAPDVLASMEINEHWPANHAHVQNGHFQLYYKGLLTGDSGRYDDGYGTLHDYGYHKRSIAHNILTVFDPNETLSYSSISSNDGGQRVPKNGGEAQNMAQWMDPEYEVGKVIGHEFGPDPMTPAYTYIKGDITKAYSSKVNEVLRSMLFMPLEDAAHPAVMFVMDKVDSANKSFKKAFLLHTLEEPTVSGSRTVIERTEKNYNGRLVVDTLLPKADNLAIEKIGGEGKEFWVNGMNYATKNGFATTTDQEGQGWGRIEISPKKEEKVDYFLNVMSVSDAGGVVKDLDSTLIEGDGLVGAVIADRVAVFAKDAKRLAGPVTFNIPGTGNFKVAVAGIKEGTWTVGGKEVIATAEGGIVYFEAQAGAVTLEYKNSNDKKDVPAANVPVTDGIGIKIGKSYIYTDTPPVLINDRTMVPLRVIFEKLEAEVEWDNDTRTVTGTKATADGSKRIVKLTIDDPTAYVDGDAVKLDSPAVIVNERTMVPLRFIAESIGANVTWDPFAKTATITPKTIIPKRTKEGLATIVDSTWTDHFEDQDGPKSYDGDSESMWSTGVSGAYVIYEFDKEYTLESVYLLLNKAVERHAVFDILSSTDGENFTSVISNGVANGKTEGEIFTFAKPVTAKYIKYIQKGSEISEWGAIKEVEFRIKQ